MDKRKDENLKRNFEKTKKRVNCRITEKIEELRRDPVFMAQLDEELQNLSKDDLQDYINSGAYEKSKSELLDQGFETEVELTEDLDKNYEIFEDNKDVAT